MARPRGQLTPASTGAFGSFRVLMQSKKFCMWAMVPSWKLSSLRTGLLSALHSFAIDGKAAAVNFQRCLCSAEFESAVINGGDIICPRTLHRIPDTAVPSEPYRGSPIVRKYIYPPSIIASLGCPFHRPVRHVDPVRE